jgi:glycosyltransferase involved in cell wall biosynthesis
MLISIVTPTYNEVENLSELVQRIECTMANCQYEYEHIIIDNCSNDGTIEQLREICKQNKKIKVILNTRNFGPLRSFYHALLSVRGEACVMLAADLQDPPELIPDMIARWEDGYKIALITKESSEENQIKYRMRKLYYSIMRMVSASPIIPNATGAGLYDREVIEKLRQLNDPNPYFRGLLGELGHPIAVIPFRQPLRKFGSSKSKFISLYDITMLGLTTHSKVPMRIMTILGFFCALVSLMISFSFLVAKLISWNSFELGIAPLLVGVFFFMSVQLLFLGLLGEYVSTIHTRLRNFPHVIEAERINF